jgi:hypothetical protein
MGWTFSRQSRSELIQKLIRTQETEQACLKVITHALRDDVLWSVVEITAKQDGVYPNLAPGQSLRVICCDLLQGGASEWGHKPLEEAMHPYYYSCPPSYLDMAPEQSREWRKGVRAYHAQHGTTTAYGTASDAPPPV